MPRNAMTVKQLSRLDRPLDNAKPRKGGFRPSKILRCSKCGKPVRGDEAEPVHKAGEYDVRYCYGCLAMINAWRIRYRLEALIQEARK